MSLEVMFDQLLWLRCFSLENKFFYCLRLSQEYFSVVVLVCELLLYE